MHVVALAEVVSYGILAGTIGDAVGSSCHDNAGVAGCVNSRRDVLNLSSIPLMANAVKRRDDAPDPVTTFHKAPGFAQD
ncbi:hypothetical protein F4779DRAFT_622577 [Xylariaceae sp. FL0662B]|nr:hypothetical protein F4779DRAFT_622577 [Xylariaceae sp. FL0662B]